MEKQKLIAHAKASMKARAMTKGTMRALLCSFRQWLGWLRNGESGVLGWEVVEAWCGHLQEQGSLKARTLCNKRAEVLRVLEMLVQDGVLGGLPSRSDRIRPSVFHRKVPAVLLEYRKQLASFSEYCHARGLLRTDYPSRLRPFLKWLGDQGITEIREVDERVLLEWRSGPGSLTVNGGLAAPTTRRSRDRYLCMYFRFLHRTRRIYLDPTEDMELTRTGRHLPRGILSKTEMRTLLSGVDVSGPSGLRDLAVLEMLYGIGLRSAELRGLKLVDIDMHAQELRVQGKGGKEGVLPFGGAVSRTLTAYLQCGRPALMLRGGVRDESHVFITVAGNPLSAERLASIVKRHAKKSGLEGRVTPHGLRHTCATHLLKGGADLRIVQSLLRHENINTTLVYTRVMTDDLRKAQRRCHPRGGEI